MSTSTSTRSSQRQRSNSVWKTNYGEEEATFAKISGIKNSKELDEGALARLGKRQELKRRFGLLSVVGFSCCILVTWESALALLQEALINGGPAGVSWGYLLAWACSTSVYMCLAEMASIAPIAGGQYFWVAILSPPPYKRFLSYITGWLTSLAWVATIGTGIVFAGTLIEGVITLEYPGYHKESYQGTLFCWAVITVALCINTLLTGIMPMLEGFILVLHILGYVAVMVSVLYLSPKVSAQEVFFRPLNLGGWSTQALSICVGFTGNVATFVGADAAVHMSEEIESAALDVPRAIFITLLLNGSMGYGIILAILFCMTDIDGAIHTKTGYAFMEVIANGCGNAAAIIVSVIVIAMIWCATIGFLATASRMMWSFARDKALPFHSIIRKVHPTTSIPIYAVLIATLIPCLLALIYIGSPTAYSDVLSMSVSGLYASYLIPCCLLFWRRVTGQIKPYNSDEFSVGDQHNPIPGRTKEAKDGLIEKETVVDFSLMWGPWRVPGFLGTLNNAFACVYCVYVLFWSFWPLHAHPNASQMNYAVVGFVAVTAFSIAYYFIHGHKEYKGPLVQLETRVGTSQ